MFPLSPWRRQGRQDVCSLDLFRHRRWQRRRSSRCPVGVPLQTPPGGMSLFAASAMAMFERDAAACNNTDFIGQVIVSELTWQMCNFV